MTDSNDRLFSDLANPKLIWTKGILFLILGLLAGSILISRMQGFSEIALLAITVWAFCRAYYFAFYVIQHYVDGDFHYSGLTDFVSYAIKRKS